MLKRLSGFFAASALVALAACGGDEGPDWVDEVDAETAEGAAETAATYAENVALYLLEGEFSTELPDDLPLVAGTTSPNLTERILARARARAYQRIDRPDLARTSSPFRVGMVCEPVISGDLDELDDPNDDDADGIPNDVTVTFPDSGTLVFFCKYHQNMGMRGALQVS